MEERAVRKIVALIIAMSAMFSSVLVARELEERPVLLAQAGEAPVRLETVNSIRDVPARTVFLDINEVTGAAKYDVVVRAITQKWQEPYRFSMEGKTLRMRLTPGRYMVKTRSIDPEGRAGFWGLWKIFWVGFRSPKEVFPRQWCDGHAERERHGAGDF